MNCTDYREMLTAYVEGLLDASQSSDLETHLRTCPTCTEELAAIQGLCGRLVADGKTYEQTSVNNTVIDRIFREQQFRLRQTEHAGFQIQLRRFIMSRYGKLAIAAVLVAAMGLSMVLFQKTGRISLAQVAEKLQQITSMSYKMRMNMTGVPGLPADQKMNMNMEMLISSTGGMRMIAYMDGKPVSTTIMDLNDKTMITLMPEMKKYMRITLTDDLINKTKQNNADPRLMIEQFLKTHCSDLGRSQIDGVEVQGFESTDPAATGGVFKDTVARIWVDIRTGYPYRMTIDGQALQEGSRIEMIADQFEWNVPCEPEMFSMAIPEEFASMGDLHIKGLSNGEELIDALKYFQELSGGRFPKSLNSMDIMQELVDLGKTQSAQPTQDQQDRLLKLTMAFTNYQMLTAQNAEPKYYGDTVQPGEADKVLVRWKTPEGNYRVIFGDLRSEEVTAERLAELEAQP